MNIPTAHTLNAKRQRSEGEGKDVSSRCFLRPSRLCAFAFKQNPESPMKNIQTSSRLRRDARENNSTWNKSERLQMWLKMDTDKAVLVCDADALPRRDFWLPRS